ncbi:DUF1127 domain-containing protein [Pelagibius sp. Alg239-R121]|uniref:DUF1127 domain-containing protein n=1 Tax=Pelagibius sp. Alg239-R121 TaxID=2993448 RepID=UPI0024A66B03|nr:DUF1127 domain-containing protein [Pelagibius sp. Alg239-R121]
MTEKPLETADQTLPRGIFAVLGTLVNHYHAVWQERRSYREARAAFMQNVYLDDKLLDDIGVTREEVDWAAGLPVQINAALALHARARRRRSGNLGTGGGASEAPERALAVAEPNVSPMCSAPTLAHFRSDAKA